jgi:cytochrome P450
MVVPERPPGPRGLPVLGVLPAIRRNPTALFTDAARRFGDVVYLKIGPRRGYLITNPADIRHVLQDNARNYHKSPLYDKLRLSLGNGLLTSEDEFWLRQRRIAQPAFHRQRLAALAGEMATTAHETAAEWQTIARSGRPVDIADEMMRITRTIVLRALLGADLGPFADRVDSAWTLINQHVGESFWSLGLTDRWATARRRRFEAARAVLREAVNYAIAERRRSLSDSADLLSMLLTARDEETGEAMTDEQLRTEVMTFLLAGQETTSLALTWTWYVLSQHADARRRLEEEVDATLGERRPEFSDLEKLRFIRMVIEEAMRLYPPAWGFSRQAMAADRVGRFHLPRGWLVFVVPYVLHRLPAFWHNPDIFDPERSRRNRAPNGRSSCTCRSARDRDSASGITSR